MNITTLPFKPYSRTAKSLIVRDFILPETLYIEQWRVPPGVEVSLITNRDFGTLVLPQECKDERGFVIPRRIFRY